MIIYMDTVSGCELVGDSYSLQRYLNTMLAATSLLIEPYTNGDDSDVGPTRVDAIATSFAYTPASNITNVQTFQQAWQQFVTLHAASMTHAQPFIQDAQAFEQVVVQEFDSFSFYNSQDASVLLCRRNHADGSGTFYYFETAMTSCKF